jgi:uncharacterized protein (DUF934 family)
MRQILRQRELTADRWRYPGEPGDGPQVRTLAELLAMTAGTAQATSTAEATAAAQAAGAPDTGVLLGPADELEPLAPWIARLALVVVHFEKNGDGRGFSQGQLLRQRYGYRGELRAQGAVKRDQVFLLARCGFDAFDLDPAEDPQAALAQLGRFSVAYQPAVDLLVRPRQRA